MRPGLGRGGSTHSLFVKTAGRIFEVGVGAMCAGLFMVVDAAGVRTEGGERESVEGWTEGMPVALGIERLRFGRNEGQAQFIYTLSISWCWAPRPVSEVDTSVTYLLYCGTEAGLAPFCYLDLRFRKHLK